MADNTQTSSPIDLGKIIINANHNMLNPGASQGNNNGEQQGLVQKNPVTGLTDDQANALASVIKAANKSHAEEAYNTLGHDGSAALIALHNIVSQGQSNAGEISPPIQQDIPTPQKNNAINNQFNAVDVNNQMMQKATNLAMQQPTSLFGGIQQALSSPSQQTRAAALQLKNITDAQSIIGQQQLQASDYQKNLLPMTAYERAQTGIQKATMLLNYGGKVSEDFQKTIQPHIDSINDGLTANTLYNNVLANPNDRQAQQAFLEQSAKLQGVKDSKTLLQGRGAASALKGLISQSAGGGAFSMAELARIQKANIAKYSNSQQAVESMTNQHQQRLQKLGLDPSQFVNQYGQTQSSGIQEGMTATNPQTGQKITFKGGKWQ